MIILHRHMTPKKVILLGITILVLIILLFFYVFIAKRSVFGWTPSASSPPTTALKSSPPSPTIDSTNKSNSSSLGSKEIPHPTTDQPSSSNAQSPSTPKTAVPLSITTVQKNEHALHIGTLINTSTTAGSCTVTLTGPPAHPISQTSGVQFSGADSTCSGFDIPIAQLSPGEWQIVVTFENDAHTGSATQITQIQ